MLLLIKAVKGKLMQKFANGNKIQSNKKNGIG